MMTRDELIERITAIDYWGARDRGPAKRTAIHIVEMLEAEGLYSEPDKPEPAPVEKGVWRHEGGSECATYGDSFDWTYAPPGSYPPFVCRSHRKRMVCYKREASDG